MPPVAPSYHSQIIETRERRQNLSGATGSDGAKMKRVMSPEPLKDAYVSRRFSLGVLHIPSRANELGSNRRLGFSSPEAMLISGCVM